MEMNLRLHLRTNTFSRSGAALCALALAAALVAAPARAEEQREEYKRQFQKSVTMRAGQPLRIEHRQGSILLRAHSQPQLEVQANIRVSAPSKDEAARFGEEIQIEVLESPVSVTVRTRYPEKESSFWSGRRNISYSVDYEILMPESAPLAVKNSFGRVEVSGIKAGAEIENSHGQLTLRDAAGTQRLTNSFGGVEVATNAGEVSVTNSNGFVRVSGIEGGLTVRNRFGEITVARVSKSEISRNVRRRERQSDARKSLCDHGCDFGHRASDGKGARRHGGAPGAGWPRSPAGRGGA